MPDQADPPKRKPGRPPAPEESRSRTVHTTLDPELYAAWKADGRPLNAILRAALLP